MNICSNYLSIAIRWTQNRWIWIENLIIGKEGERRNRIFSSIWKVFCFWLLFCSQVTSRSRRVMIFFVRKNQSKLRKIFKTQKKIFEADYTVTRLLFLYIKTKIIIQMLSRLFFQYIKINIFVIALRGNWAYCTSAAQIH